MGDQVTICEMASRDGMQALNQSSMIPFEMRLELIRALMRARVAYIEVGSFVNPKVMPQMQDTAALFEQIDRREFNGQLAALVPNVRQYERCIDTPNLTTIALFVSASEEYSQKNKRVSIAQDLADARGIAELARRRGHRLRAHVSAAFREPLKTRVQTDPALVQRMCRALLDIGCETIALADTDGRAVPPDMQRTITDLLEHGIHATRLGVHLHDRFGHAIANAWEAYRLGIRSFDSAVGGIGGNRALEDSVGNIATEQIVMFFQHMGVETGIDLDALREAHSLVQKMIELVDEC